MESNGVVECVCYIVKQAHTVTPVVDVVLITSGGRCEVTRDAGLEDLSTCRSRRIWMPKLDKTAFISLAKRGVLTRPM